MSMRGGKRSIGLVACVTGMVFCACGLGLMILHHPRASSIDVDQGPLVSDKMDAATGNTAHFSAETPVAAETQTPRVQPSEAILEKPENVAPEKSISGDSLAAVVAERVKALKEAHLGSRKIVEQLELLARASDEISIRMLLDLSEDPAFREKAILALGYARTPAMKFRVAAEMRNKLSAADAGTVCAAATTYAKVAKNAAIPDLQALIAQNWMRSDGRGLQVCAAAVRGLGAMETPEADQALMSQLLRVHEPGWLPDYGSTVVAALAGTGRNVAEATARGAAQGGDRPKALSAKAVMALSMYAGALATKMPGADNPPGRKYYEEKIAEIHAALAQGEETGRSTTPPDPDQVP